MDFVCRYVEDIKYSEEGEAILNNFRSDKHQRDFTKENFDDSKNLKLTSHLTNLNQSSQFKISR